MPKVKSIFNRLCDSENKNSPLARLCIVFLFLFSFIRFLLTLLISICFRTHIPRSPSALSFFYILFFLPSFFIFYLWWKMLELNVCLRCGRDWIWITPQPPDLKAVAPCINNKTIQKGLCMEDDVYGATWKTRADLHRGLVRASQKTRFAQITRRITMIKH